MVYTRSWVISSHPAEAHQSPSFAKFNQQEEASLCEPEITAYSNLNTLGKWLIDFKYCK